MAPSSTLVSAPRRSHHLSSMKSTIFGNSLPSNSHRRSTSGSTPTKRPLFNDENADPTGLSNSKRVKSAIQPSVLTSKPTNEHPKQSTASSGKQPSRFILTDKQPSSQQKRSALGNITNTHHRVEKSSSKPRIGSSLKNVVSNASPPRRNRPTTSPRTGREARRAQRVPFAVRIDPPVSDSTPLGSIDSALSDAVSRSRSNSLLTPSNDVASSLSLDSSISSGIPDSWVFTIYEDTPEETMQNMMEHSTHTLDLSDDESSRSELSERGKENIPPSRLAELMATVPEERGNQMRVDMTEKNIPQRKVSDRALDGERTPLREMEAAELVNEEVKEEIKEEVKVPTLEKEGFMTVTTPEKKKTPAPPKGKGALGWTVWSDNDTKTESENELPTPPPVGRVAPRGFGVRTGKAGGLRRKLSDGAKKRALSEI